MRTSGETNSPIYVEQAQGEEEKKKNNNNIKRGAKTEPGASLLFDLWDLPTLTP